MMSAEALGRYKTEVEDTLERREKATVAPKTS